MRILHIVSLITPDGAYGGPARVALSQAKSLAEKGHEVTVAAGSFGYGENTPTEYDGVPLKLFPVIRIIPKTGFAGLTSPKLLTWLTKNCEDFDVVHVHLARDFLTMASAYVVRRKKVPYVVQTHGMVDPSTKLLSIPLDAGWTRRILRDAKRVFYLNEREKGNIKAVARQNLRFQELRNGVESADICPRKLSHDQHQVLFLSRLDPQKRAINFVRMAVSLHKRNANLRFALVGPDEGDAQLVLAEIAMTNAASYVHWEGSLPPDQTSKRMYEADVVVLPSFKDTFPMSILESLALGIPVVVTESCGISGDIRSSDSGNIAIDDDVMSLVESVESLLSDEAVYTDKSRNALASIRDVFNISNVTSVLEIAYADHGSAGE